MKRGTVLLLVLILVVALAAGWWWARTSPEQVTQVLVSGGLESGRAEQFVDTFGGRTQAEGAENLVASGSIEGEEVVIVSEFGGKIVAIDAGEGDEVEVGQVLVELDTSLLEAQMVQAKAGVEAARADLAALKAGTHPAEILAAEASLRKAETERDAARAAWEDLQHLVEDPQDLQAQIVQARSAVDVAEAQIEQAKAEIALAEAERFKYRGQGSLEEKYMYRVHDYQVKAAEAGLEKAEVDKAGAERTLATLTAVRDQPLAMIDQVHRAEGQYQVAEKGVEVARTRLTELNAGPTAEEVAVTEARVREAEAGVSALQVQIDKMTLRSPIAGVVSSRSAHEGEAATAGATLMTVANLDEVKLTVYVPQTRLGEVLLGQEVEVEVDSFPGRVFPGTVSYISQQAEFTPKNVQTEEERVNMVFAVKVRLPNLDHWLKPGMPADAYWGRQ
jgi:multidrug resistance efflux pump